MDLTAKVAALEEELTLVKGEIKLILQEVRTALLARDNPFSPTFAPAEPPRMATPIRTHEAPDEMMPAVIRLVEPPQETPPPPRKDAPAEGRALPREPKSTMEESQSPTAQGAPDSHVLAALMAWTQQATERYTADELEIVVTLARYGGYFNAELADTLLQLSRSLAGGEPDLPAATITDYLLTLHQLEAVVGRTRNGTHQVA